MLHAIEESGRGGPESARRPRGETGAVDDRDDPPPPAAGRPEISVEYMLVSPLPRHEVAEEATWLELHAIRAAAESVAPVRRLGVRVVNDVEMARLHAVYLGIDEPTDVLTFPTGDHAEGAEVAAGISSAVDVDIVVNREEAARCALRARHPVRHELLLYIVHGMLHESGYDDRDPDEARRMHAEEDRILSAVGVGSVFGAGATGGVDDSETGEARS